MLPSLGLIYKATPPLASMDKKSGWVMTYKPRVWGSLSILELRMTPHSWSRLALLTSHI